MKTTYKALLVSIIIMILLFATSVMIYANSASTTRADGYIEISTPEQLNDIRNNTGGNYILTKDINMQGFSNWEPVASFEGILDGNGFSIENLHCDNTDGCFIKSNSGTIENLSFVNLDIITGLYAGISIDNYGTFDNVFVHGQMQCALGGGISYMNYGKIQNCATNVKFDAPMEATGISVGNSGEIQNCLVLFMDAGGEGANNYTIAGGYLNGGKVSNCVGIGGYGATSHCVHKNNICNGVYYLNSCSVQYDANAAGVSDVQLGDKQAFSNLDFTEVWEMSNQGFPILKNNPVQKYMDGLTDIHKPVKNLKVEGYSYKSIKLTWDPVENAKEYLIVSQKAPWNRYVVTRDTSFVDDDLQSQGKPLKSVKYYVIPVFNHNDMDFYGTHAAYGIGSPVDVESESSYTDYVYPEYVGMRVLTEKAYKPGLVEVEVSAKDLDSGISSITVELSIPFDYDLPGFSHTMNFSGEKEVTTVVKVPVPLGVKSGNYKVTSIKITDMAGNTDGPSYQGYFGGEQLADSSIYIDDEFDVEFTGALSNASVPSQLKNMAEGKTVVLKINEKSKGILKKEILDAIKGQDKTVVVYADDNASMQWVFYGKDITGTTKDININVKVEKVSGNRFGSKFDVIKLEYADNGKLPGLIQFRLKSNYISAINNSKEDLFLYYDNGKELSLEQSNCPIIKDGKSNWCYMDLGHNSTFYLSSEELTKYAGVKFKGTVKLSKSEYVYTGGAKNPKLTVKTSDGKTLKQGKDYTVSTPKGRKAIGKYTYTVKFKGNYSGTNTVTLMIKPKAPTIKTPTASKKAITVKWKNVKKSQATGYQVMVATDKNFTKNVKKSFVKGYSKASKKMTKLKAKTKYFVKVRTYKTVKGIKIYSDWSKVKQIKTK